MSIKKYYKDNSNCVFQLLITLNNAHNTMVSEKQYMLQNGIYGVLSLCLKVINITIID